MVEVVRSNTEGTRAGRRDPALRVGPASVEVLRDRVSSTPASLLRLRPVGTPSGRDGSDGTIWRVEASRQDRLRQASEEFSAAQTEMPLRIEVGAEVHEDRREVIITRPRMQHRVDLILDGRRRSFREPLECIVEGLDGIPVVRLPARVQGARKPPGEGRKGAPQSRGIKMVHRCHGSPPRSMDAQTRRRTPVACGNSVSVNVLQHRAVFQLPHPFADLREHLSSAARPLIGSVVRVHPVQEGVDVLVLGIVDVERAVLTRHDSDLVAGEPVEVEVKVVSHRRVVLPPEREQILDESADQGDAVAVVREIDLVE
ncbi:hypothetical protein Cus16_0495 [Curtobacterium sp. ER1/6]|nr:hypothetical protein Cus16_0495 [Curtobacterium sp. ER1/6]